MSDFKSKSILLYFSLAFIFLSFAIAPVSAEIKEDATIRGYHDILYTNIIESAFNNNPEVITVNSYLDYNSSIDVSLSGSPNTLVTKSFVEDLVESIELDSPYYNLVANRASVNSNHRHELRIPWPSTHSGPLILDVEVLVDTNSVATRHYKVKRFYLTTISSSNPGEIYSQNSFVLNSLGGSTGTYNYIDIFREDTSSGDIVLDIYTSHNRALSVRVSAWGSDNVVDLVSDASFDANVENVGSIPSRADVELGLNDNVFVHNDLVVDGTSEFNDYLTLRGDLFLRGNIIEPDSVLRINAQSNHLYLETNDTERLRIQHGTGNIRIANRLGVGTPSWPGGGYSLDVVGTGRFTSSSDSSDFSTISYSSINLGRNSWNYLSANDGTGLVLSAGGGYLWAGSQPGVFVRDNGRVGLGYHNPTERLSVRGSIFVSDNIRSDNSLGFFVNNNRRMTLTQNGRLGIGTSNPTRALDVAGDVRFRGGSIETRHFVTFTAVREAGDWGQNNNRRYLRTSWNSDLSDFLYLGAVGNQSNAAQSAIILSRSQGFLFGRGSNDADSLSEEVFSISRDGNVSAAGGLSLEGDIILTDSAGECWRIYVDTSGQLQTDSAGCSAKCGSRNRQYSHNSMGWGDGNFCDNGDVSPSSPQFPNPGQTTSWTCEVSGAPDAQCSANRNIPPMVDAPTDFSVSVYGSQDNFALQYGQNDMLDQIIDEFNNDGGLDECSVSSPLVLDFDWTNSNLNHQTQQVYYGVDLELPNGFSYHFVGNNDYFRENQGTFTFNLDAENYDQSFIFLVDGDHIDYETNYISLGFRLIVEDDYNSFEHIVDKNINLDVCGIGVPDYDVCEGDNPPNNCWSVHQ